MPSFQVNRFRVVIQGAQGGIGESVGWIELLNNTTPTGYIYLHNRADTVSLPGDTLSSSNYVVMHQRVKYLESMLTILKGPKPLSISISSATGGLALLSSAVVTSFDDDAVTDQEASELDPNRLLEANSPY